MGLDHAPRQRCYSGRALRVRTLLYAFPRTAIAGSVLLSSYLGGAVASQLRAGNGWFNIMFPVILGGIVWSGLWLRDTRARNLLS